MRQSELIEKISMALTKALSGKQLPELRFEMKLRDDLGLDSITSLTFLMALEEEIEGFTVNPDTLGMDDLDSIRSIGDYVKRQIKDSVNR